MGVQIGLGFKTQECLYELVSNQPSRGLTCSLSCTASSFDWHRHLGHPSLTKLRQALPWISFKKFLCESCEMGKHHRATFPRIESIPSSKPFDLVHCDIWGPSRLPSLLGFCHYMVLIDDYSHVSWVYLLKDRTEVLSMIHQFLQKVTTQYVCTPKVLRRDNATELVQKDFQSLCTSSGILHQTSCPHTSQQNGVAERKHRHFLDMTHTLFYKMGVPHEFWDDATLTFAFLINRHPSTLLGGEVPLRHLHPNRELFSLPPCVFGCIAFAQDHSSNISKLNPHAV